DRARADVEVHVHDLVVPLRARGSVHRRRLAKGLDHSELAAEDPLVGGERLAAVAVEMQVGMYAQHGDAPIGRGERDGKGKRSRARRQLTAPSGARAGRPSCGATSRGTTV